MPTPLSKRWTLISGEDEFELGPALTLGGRRTFAHWNGECGANRSQATVTLTYKSYENCSETYATFQ